VERASWPAVRARFQAINFVMTPRCARERGPGGPHYVQNLHTYRTSTRTEPPHVQNLHTYRTSTGTKPPKVQNRTTNRTALRKYRTALRTYNSFGEDYFNRASICSSSNFACAPACSSGWPSGIPGRMCLVAVSQLSFRRFCFSEIFWKISLAFGCVGSPFVSSLSPQ